MESSLRQLIRILVEETEKEDIEEMSGVGAIAGYVAPLGDPGGAPEEMPHSKPRKNKSKNS